MVEPVRRRFSAVRQSWRGDIARACAICSGGSGPGGLYSLRGCSRYREDDKGTRHEIAVRSAGWGVLAAEVYDDDKILVRLEAPGMEKADFDLELLDDYLVIRGEKRIESERTEGRYRVTECAYGCFERAIPLPEQVESAEARASYTSGVLRIELPKSVARRRTIKVDVH